MPVKKDECFIDCYDCQHRGTIPGDAHSRCAHPDVRKTGISDCYITALAEAFMGRALLAQQNLGVKGGGQTWPANFNPVFLTACRGFRSKDNKKKEESCRR